jgi:hypothetical protein
MKMGEIAMVDYEKFWTSLQLGKWRSESIQKQFLNNFSKIILFLFAWYIVALFLGIEVVQPNIPSLAKFDFPTFLSALLGLFIAMASIGLGFNSYFIQQQTKPEIITYLGTIDYQDTRSLVTFINKGQTIVIRYTAIVALKEIRGIFRRFSTLPRFDILDSEMISHGWHILREKECSGISEEDIKKAIIMLENRIGTTKEEGIKIATLAFDETFDIRRQQETENKAIIGGCKLGEYAEIVDYAHGKQGIPGLVHGHETYISMQKNDYKRSLSGEKVTAKFIQETPPNVWDMDYEIWKKLDSIEKLMEHDVWRKLDSIERSLSNIHQSNRKKKASS